jgi:hypothetical protein
LHTCLKADPRSFDQSFPKLQMRVNTGSVRNAPSGMMLATLTSLLGFMPRVIASGISGAYKQTPFFQAPSGAPRFAVHVLSEADRKRAYEVA